MKTLTKLNSIILLVSAIALNIEADEIFSVQDIRIEGLQRVSAGTVFGSLPIDIGDQVDESILRASTRALFRTGYFADVLLSRENNILVITLAERPSVSEIILEGNKAIETDQLLGALRDNGLAEGQIFRQIILEGMSQELERQYVAQGLSLIHI